MSPLTRQAHCGRYAASVSIRSGRGSTTHDRVLRFVPILALTTESQQAKRDEAKKLGATGWLVKPVASAELVRIIRQVLPGA